MIQQVDIVLSTTSILAVPGSTHELGVTVTNNSQEVERFELSISDLDPSWYQFDWADMLLYPNPPGNESTSYVRITVPPDAQSGTYAAAVEITGSQSGVMRQPFILTINSVADAKPQITLSPEIQETRNRSARFQIGLQNPLTRPISLPLFAHSARPDVRIHIMPPVADLPPFGELTSLLEIQPLRRNWYKSEQRYDFSIGAEGLDTEVSGTLLQSCALPWLRQLLTTPALLAAALLLPLLLGGLMVVLTWPRQSNSGLPTAECVVPNQSRTVTFQPRGDSTAIVVADLNSNGARPVITEPSNRLPGIFASLVSVSPDGNSLAYVTAKNENLDEAVIYTLNINSGARQPVVSVNNGLWTSRPIWSKDGTQLSYVVRNNSQLELWTVNTEGVDKKAQAIAAPRQLDPALFYGSPSNGPVCWSTDGTRLIIRSNASATQQTEVSINGGKVQDVTRPPSGLPLTQQLDQKVALPIKEPDLVSLSDSACSIPTFSQNDPRWRDQPMRPLGDKIGDVGCPVTAAAMMLNYYKLTNINPNELNNCLGNDAYPFTGFDWTLPASKCSQNQVQGGKRTPFSWEVLNDILSKGQPAIVGLLGGQYGVHYVVVVGGSNSIAATYRVNDPWDGTNYKSIRFFLDNGYKLGWLVTYSGSNAPSCPSRLVADPKFDPGFQLQIPKDGVLYNAPIAINYTVTGGATISGTLFGTAPIPTNPDGTTSTTAGPTTLTPRKISNGLVVDAEASYSLVMDNITDPANPLRLTTQFMVDTTPPVVSLSAATNSVLDPSLLQPDGSYMVRNKSVPLDFKATDNLSGVASIEYRIKDANTDSGWLLYNQSPNSHPIVIEKDGSYSLFVKATDGAGNVVEGQEIKFQIELTKPDAIPGLSTATSATQTAAVATTIPTDTAPGTGVTNTNTTTPPPGTLTAIPNQITFDQSIAVGAGVTIQLSNPGPGPVSWTLQPLSGKAATQLQVLANSGTIQAGGSQPLTVQLSSFNFETSLISLSLNVAFNNNVLQIPVIVAAQPAPTVSFSNPAPNTALSGRLIPIKLSVSTIGAAKPNHATLTGSYTEQAGAPPTEKPLMGGQFLVGPDWTLNWDISTIPPQSPINLNATICWSADDSICLKNVANLGGLSIPKPGALLTLNPGSDKLSGTVLISAQVTGAVDHISLKYTAGGAPVELPRADSTNNYSSKWDTTAIPPQSGIVLTALVCWGPDDNPNSCSPPANANTLPASFTVEAPTLTFTLADADAKELPVQLNLSGTASKINNSATTVFVIVSAPGGVEDNTNYPSNALPLGAGPTTWAITIDTSKWPSSAAIKFSTKICWDGDIKGKYCFDGPGATAQISPFTATLTPAPPDLSAPVNLAAVPSPAKRVTRVKFLVSYTNTNNLPGVTNFTDKPLTLLADNTNNFTIANFDSVAAGLKPGQASFKLVACGDTDASCGTPSSPVTLQIPLSTLTNTAPDQATLAGTSLPTGFNQTQSISGKIGGRGASSVTLVATYNPQPDKGSSLTTNSVSITLTSVLLNQSVTFKAAFQDIPPQSDIKLSAVFCWQGDLDSTLGCSDPSTYIYTGLFISLPKILNFYEVRTQAAKPYTATDVLVPITTSLGTRSTPISIPVDADTMALPNIRSINFQLISSASPGQPLSKATVDVDTTTGRAIQGTSLTFNAGNVSANTTLTIQVSPVWFNTTGTLTTDYSFAPAAVFTIPVKLVETTVQMDAKTAPNGTPNLTAVPASGPFLMFRQKTYVGLQFSGVNAGLVKKVLFYATSAQLGQLPPQFLGAATSAANNTWTYNWDHGTDTINPRLSLDDDIILSWRICTDGTVVDDSPNSDPSCTPRSVPGGNSPPNMNGSLWQLSPLKLVGIQFDVNNNADVKAGSGNFFNSTFTANILINNASVFSPTNTSGLIKQIRIIASPINPGSTQDSRVLLGATNVITNATSFGTNVRLDVYWPDDPTSDPYNNPANRTIGALIKNSVNQNIRLSAQYCFDANPQLPLNTY